MPGSRIDEMAHMVKILACKQANELMFWNQEKFHVYHNQLLPDRDHAHNLLSFTCLREHPIAAWNDDQCDILT